MSQITSRVIDTDTLNACLADLPHMSAFEDGESAAQQMRRMWSTSYYAHGFWKGMDSHQVFLT